MDLLTFSIVLFLVVVAVFAVGWFVKKKKSSSSNVIIDEKMRKARCAAIDDLFKKNSDFGLTYKFIELTKHCEDDDFLQLYEQLEKKVNAQCRKESPNIDYLEQKEDPSYKLTPADETVYEIKIRKLKRRDRVFFSDMIKRIMNATNDDSLAKMISSNKAAARDQSESEEEEMGRFIAKMCTDTLCAGIDLFDTEIVPWFQDLLQVTPEEYDELPMNIEFRVLDYIVNHPDAGGFFMQSLRTAKMTQWLEKPLNVMKEWLNPILDSAKESFVNSNT